MPVPRLLAAAIGLLLPLALVSTMAASAQAAPHRHAVHHAAQVRTATHRVHAPTRPPHRLRASSHSHRHHLAQATTPHTQRHHTTRRS